MIRSALILDCHETLPGLPAADLEILSADERDKAYRFVFERDRQQYVRAAALLRRTLAVQCGVAPAQIDFERTPYGKPRLAARCQPESGTGRCEFNLSHTAGGILIGLAPAVLGVDIEFAGGRDFPVEIMPRVFTGLERVAIETHSTGVQIAGFAHWTRKEAVIKADGRGLSLDPASFDIVPTSLPTRATETLRDQWQCEVAGTIYFGATTALKAGLICSIATVAQQIRDELLAQFDGFRRM